MKIKRPVSKQPIPKHAKKVFQGVIFDVYQWRQKLFDGSYGTYEKIKRLDTVNLIAVTHAGKIIVTQQEQPGMKPFFGLPGGKIDFGETPLVAAKRELNEETGHKGRKYILWHAIQPFSQLDWASYNFIVKDCKKVADLKLDAGEKIKLIYFSFDEFINLVLRDNLRDVGVALAIFKLQQNPVDFKKFKKLLTD